VGAFNVIFVRQLFGGIALEADSLLKELESSLQKQEAELTAYARQQKEVRDFWFFGWTSELEMLNSIYCMQAHARAVENTRAVSKITVNFFETLHMHASNLIQIVEESQSTNDQKLYELQKKFEVTEVPFFVEFAQITIGNFLILLGLLTFTHLVIYWV